VSQVLEQGAQFRSHDLETLGQLTQFVPPLDQDRPSEVTARDPASLVGQPP